MRSSAYHYEAILKSRPVGDAHPAGPGRRMKLAVLWPSGHPARLPLAQTAALSRPSGGSSSVLDGQEFMRISSLQACTACSRGVSRPPSGDTYLRRGISTGGNGFPELSARPLQLPATPFPRGVSSLGGGVSRSAELDDRNSLATASAPTASRARRCDAVAALLRV